MSPEKATKSKNPESEIVVIGGGGAGIPAALTAAEKGATRVIVLEKRLNIGGNASLAGGFLFAAESHLQKEAKVDVSRDAIFKDTLEWHHFVVNPRILRAFINKTADTIRWLEEKGIAFELKFGAHVLKDMTQPVGGFGAKMKLLAKECQDRGVQILLRTSAKKILRGADGKVTGVLAIRGKEEFEIKTRSVIITTGGFLGNKELLSKYFPFYDDTFQTGALTHTGDGVFMAAEAGAAMADFATLIRESCFSSGKNIPNRAAREPLTVWVNNRGERFIDETFCSHLHSSNNALLQQPGKMAYALYDDKMVQSVIERPDPWASVTSRGEPREKVPDFREKLRAGDKSGEWVKISDTWDGIADWIGASPEALKTTMDEYNASCDRGYDETFAKEKKCLVPLRNPPYYAIKFGTLLIDTVGPVRVNERMEVVDKQDNPIPGLYAAGVVTSGWQWYDYRLFGSALSYSINSGRIAGENALTYIKSIGK